MGSDNSNKKPNRCSMMLPIVLGFLLGGVATIGMIIEDPELFAGTGLLPVDKTPEQKDANAHHEIVPYKSPEEKSATVGDAAARELATKSPILEAVTAAPTAAATEAPAVKRVTTTKVIRASPVHPASAHPLALRSIEPQSVHPTIDPTPRLVPRPPRSTPPTSSIPTSTPRTTQTCVAWTFKPPKGTSRLVANAQHTVVTPAVENTSSTCHSNNHRTNTTARAVHRA
jgi:hypothetical protein